MTTLDYVTQCDDYLASRTGRYEYRAVRYNAAARALRNMGLNHDHTVLDIGAGWTELDYCLRNRPWDWRGRYIPIDGGIDGTDLNHWKPPRNYEFVVGLEILEHLQDPGELVWQLQSHATKGVVVSVPNPRTVDVLGIDPTHITVVTRQFLLRWGFEVTEQTFCGGVWSNGEPDSLFGVWRA